MSRQQMLLVSNLENRIPFKVLFKFLLIFFTYLVKRSTINVKRSRGLSKTC